MKEQYTSGQEKVEAFQIPDPSCEVKCEDYPRCDCGADQEDK